ncbi:MAG: phosphoglucosamine mutase [Candidatus Nanopelagicales bacterium]|nr:phosphoglucosamine mutase [Candidatus Nanopelagicales bacterium]
MGRLFGTDGVRGLANRDLTAELALDLAVAAAHVLGEVGSFAGHRPRAVVGRDSRISGQFLESAIVAGLASAGVDVITLGVVPTPTVAFLTDALGADLGVMLSASHNPMPDNGIKFFARGGHKLDDVIEDAIEARLREPWERPLGADIGHIQANGIAVELYETHLLRTLPNHLDGLRVVVDCANGAASAVAPAVLRAAGAEVIAIHAEPNGLNINENCGSTHLEDLIAAVLEHGADAGIAHDGDADRCLAVAADGSVIDGDHILAILAIGMHEAGTLAGGTVVATVMANLGFKLAMQQHGIAVVETGVGDRYVLEAMKAGAFALGGEQSGHVVMLEHATTGDGLLTALHLLARMTATGQSLAQLAAELVKLPQVLVNVRNVDKAALESSAEVAAAVAAAEAELGADGRVLLRSSGTEPVIRVMVEARSSEVAQRITDQLAQVVQSALPLP